MRMTKQQMTEYTRDLWQPQLDRRLTDEDAREIFENVTGFFSTLADWSGRQTESGAHAAQSGDS